jgi:uncharacterized membrane protein
MRLLHDEHEHEEGTARIEAFSDGVYAIAITLLVIEIGVPAVTSDESLGTALRHLWPSYFAYILSFVTIGISWANHHSFFRMFTRSDHYFLMLNVFFLMCIAFLPFPTAVLGEYLDSDSQRQTAVVFYTAGRLAPATAWLAVWGYGNWHGLVDENLHPDYTRLRTLQYAATAGLYVLAVALAFWQPYVALAIVVSITGFYLLPPRPRRYIGAETETVI